MTTIRAFVERAYPEADGSHDWMPEYGDDNIECSNCCVRPYNKDASTPCGEIVRKLLAKLPVVRGDSPF